MLTPEIIAQVDAWLYERKGNPFYGNMLDGWQATAAALHSCRTRESIVSDDAALAQVHALARVYEASLMGLLLAIVREAWGDPMLSVGQAFAWRGKGLEFCTEWEIEGQDRRHPEGSYKTEAEALLATLKAAPEAQS